MIYETTLGTVLCELDTVSKMTYHPCYMVVSVSLVFALCLPDTGGSMLHILVQKLSQLWLVCVCDLSGYQFSVYDFSPLLYFHSSQDPSFSFGHSGNWSKD